MNAIDHMKRHFIEKGCTNINDYVCVKSNYTLLQSGIEVSYYLLYHVAVGFVAVVNTDMRAIKGMDERKS